VFTTPNPPGSPAHGQAAAGTTWIVTDYDPAAYRVAYLWINSGGSTRRINSGRVITELRIQVTPFDQGSSSTHICYRYTGLSPDGNRELQYYTQNWFEASMKNWQTTINHCLRTGRKISAELHEIPPARATS
jgi:hypothetical protein